MHVRSRVGVVVVWIIGLLVITAADASAQQRRRPRARPQGQSTTQTPSPSDSVPDQTPTTSDEDATAEAGQSTASTPALSPAPAAQEVATVEEPAAGPDLGPLQAEYAAIMDELVKARARVAIVGKALFKTKLRIVIENRAGDAQMLERVVLRLDGAPIYRGDSSAQLQDGTQVFEGFATPGPHVLEIEAEQRSRAAESYGYTLRDGFRISVQKDRLTEIRIVLDDDSDMAEDFPEDGEGEYDVRVRVQAESLPLEAR